MAGELREIEEIALPAYQRSEFLAGFASEDTRRTSPEGSAKVTKDDPTTSPPETPLTEVIEARGNPIVVYVVPLYRNPRPP
jgi:hypothetical protein